jgi:hypothetical protein
MNTVAKWIVTGGILVIIGSIFLFGMNQWLGIFSNSVDPNDNSTITTNLTSTNTDTSTQTTATSCMIPRFIRFNYIDLTKIEKISRFRSGIGHTYTDSSESCRSMKHYFVPYTNTSWAEVAIFSPINGTIFDLVPEWAGLKIIIQSTLYPHIKFFIFHVNPFGNLSVGDIVTEGQQIGYHVGEETFSDIAVQCWLTPTKYLSFFDLIEDSLFDQYHNRGVEGRSDLIISQEDRDNNPLICDETGQFVSTSSLSDWVYLT